MGQQGIIKFKVSGVLRQRPWCGSVPQQPHWGVPSSLLLKALLSEPVLWLLSIPGGACMFYKFTCTQTCTFSSSGNWLEGILHEVMMWMTTMQWNIQSRQ
jgi:hypothetical protein